MRADSFLDIRFLGLCTFASMALTFSGEASVVKGRAVDTQGRPLRGAEVVVNSTVHSYSYIKAKTGVDGRYSIELTPMNSWEADAYLTREYNGKSYCMELHPDSTDHFGSTEGAVRNFDWRLRGLKPDQTRRNEYSSYYGAAAKLDSGDYNRPVDFKYVTIRFVPAGPLVDGTAGETLNLSAAIWHWESEGYVIGDIPLGRYLVSAEYAPPRAGRFPLRLSPSMQGPYAGSIVIDFALRGGGECGTPMAKIYVIR